MNRYSLFQAEHRRWAILQALTEMPGERLNADVLQMALVDAGYECSYGAILGDLIWLNERGLVALEGIMKVAGEIRIAVLTRKGGDAAAGREHVEGLRRPLSGKIGLQHGRHQ